MPFHAASIPSITADITARGQDNGLLNVVDTHIWYKKDGTKFTIKGTKDGFVPNPHSFKAVSVLAVALVPNVTTSNFAGPVPGGGTFKVYGADQRVDSCPS